jgi:hypothetical protein
MKGLSSIYSILNGFVFLFSFFVKEPEPIIYSCFLICVFNILQKLGRGIVLREVIALFNSFIYLLMPLMGYLFFTKANTKAFEFIRYMPVTKQQYFSLALPAITGFIFFLCLPLSSTHSDEGQGLNRMIERAKRVLSGNSRVGLWMIGIGAISSLVLPFMPQVLRYIFQLIYLSSFVGVMYLYFSGRSPINNVYIGLYALFIVIVSLSSGMFTIIAYMGMTVFSFLFLNRRAAMWKKLFFFTISLFILVIIQTVKADYRDKTKITRGYSNVFTRFSYLFLKKFETADNIFSPDFMWPIYYRSNQGFYVAMVQKHIPKSRPHDKGKKLGIVFLSAFVPRVLWPDKPQAGGFENMKYYAGFILRGYTMNVGPLGEAYGSFGKNGAILYMLGLGLLIRFAYRQVFVVGGRIPLVVLWLPLLFFEVTYAGENDTLQIVNSLVKASVFVYIIYKALPLLFRVKNKPN